MAYPSEHAWGKEDDAREGCDVTGRAEGEHIVFRAYGDSI